MDQYGICPSFLPTDPWAIYHLSEVDPWVKFPLVYRSVHLFVPATSLPSSPFEPYRKIFDPPPPSTPNTLYGSAAVLSHIFNLRKPNEQKERLWMFS